VLPLEQSVAVEKTTPAVANDSAAKTEQQRFEEEVQLLDEARSLRISNPSRALQLLDEHARKFPRGKLGFDRELLTIEALRHAGRLGDARTRALGLLESAKGKPNEEKMRKLVESL
jgi:hypothetical protein